MVGRKDDLTKKYMKNPERFADFFNGIIFYARATLAMAIYFIGIALIIRSKKKIISSLIGCVCVISSALFHRELLVAIGLAPVIFIQVTNKNYKRIVALILLISIPAIFLVLSNPQLLTDMTNNETYAERFESYQNEIASGAWGGKNIYGYIVMVIRHIIYYLILFVIARVFLKREKRYEKNEGFEAMRKLFQLVFAIIIVATLFFIVFGFGPFFYRILFISAIPLSLLLCYLFINKYISKRTMMCLALFSLFVYTVNLMGI